ncbi:MAG: transposase [Candidatus Latescibacterota bacterium]
MEARFARDVNHQISKRLVAKAEGTARGIALEDLGGIRERLTVRRPQRRSQHAWTFRQPRAFVEYKARRVGLPVVLVDPRNTSRSCPRCGLADQANRPSQALFRCIQCGFSGHADTIAAENIRRVAVNQPYAAVA